MIIFQETNYTKHGIHKRYKFIRIHSCHIAKSTFRSNARQGKPENMSDVERKDDMTN